MRSRLIGIALAALVLTASAYGNAIFAPGVSSLPGGQSISFTPKATGTTIIGTVGTNMVQFSSAEGLVVHANGKELDPVKGSTLHDITIMSTGNVFTGIVFDTFQAKTPDVQVVATMSDGKTFSTTIGGASGHDFLQITTGGGELISNVSIMSTAGFSNLRSDEILGLAPAPPPIIPEPSSMLLLGSGVLVFTQMLRRKLL